MEERRSEYREEIKNLKAEIAFMEKQLEMKKIFDVSTINWKFLISKNLSKLSDIKPEERSAVESMNKEFISEIELMKHWTGIQITDVVSLNETFDVNEGIRYQIKGSSHGILFHLKFTVNKDEKGNDLLKDVEIESTDVVNDSLSEIFNRLEADCNIGDFMVIFSNYTKLMREREKCFVELTASYKDWIKPLKAPYSSSIEICSAKNDSVRFRIFWNLSVLESYEVTSDINIKHTLSKEDTRYSRISSSLQQSKQMFKDSRCTEGVEAFITAVIELLS